MIQISIIVEIRELGPHGPGRCAVGFSKLNVEKLMPEKKWAERFFDALRRATSQREKNLQEIERIATKQRDLFNHAPEPF